MKTETVKLADRGTTGLLQFLATGPDKLFPARMAKVRKVIESRTKSTFAVAVFLETARDERADRTGQTKPILSPIKRLEAAAAGDPKAFHHA